MVRSSRPVRWFAAGLAAAASVSPVWSAAGAETPGPRPAAYTYATPAGERFFALAVRPTDLTGAHRPADRHVVLVDTSASQVGEHRDRAIAVTEALLAALPANATVAVYAIDTTAVPLTDGFVPAASAAAGASAKLHARTPLGATDLAAGLNTAVKSFGDAPAGSIVYIGDGMSAANLLRTGELKSLTDRLRDRRIPVHGYAIGPNTDWRLLGVLAHQTGGVVEVDCLTPEDKDPTPGQVGGRLAAAAAAPVLYPTRIDYAGGSSAAPLRGDRETILVGRGEVPTEVRIAVGDRRSTLPMAAVRPAEGQAAVRALALASERSDGLDMPAAGTDLLAAAGAAVESDVERLAEAGRKSARTGRAAEARMVLTALTDADPSGAETANLELLVAQLDDGPGLDLSPAAAPAVPPEPAPAGDSDLLNEALQRERVLTQQLTVATNAIIEQARQLRVADPEEALSLLKRHEGSVRLAGDIEPDARRQLLRRLDNEIVATANLQEKLDQDLVLRQERLAQVEAEERIIERMVLNEERLEQLIDRVRALVDAGYHGSDASFEEAIVVARDAVNLRPGNAAGTAALFTSTAADQLNKAFRLRGLRAERFLEVLYQVELSHVPFPDEPPVVYPAAEIWQALTERRAKYASVSLETTSPAEERIRAALDEETVLEFSGTPIGEALTFLADYHNINIIPDEQAFTDEGTSLDDPVDLVLSGITLRSALRIMLGPKNLTYVIEDEVMKITSQTIADEKLSTRVYPVGDLVIPIAQPLAGGLGQGQGGVGGFQGQGGMGQGGQFGAGAQGFGGGGQGGGAGGAGLFSVPAQQVPGANPVPGTKKPGRDVPQQRDAARPVDDAALRGLLDGVLDEKTTAVVRGQSFASVPVETRDETPADGKKKA